MSLFSEKESDNTHEVHGLLTQRQHTYEQQQCMIAQSESRAKIGPCKGVPQLHVGFLGHDLVQLDVERSDGHLPYPIMNHVITRNEVASCAHGCYSLLHYVVGTTCQSAVSQKSLAVSLCAVGNMSCQPV